MRIKLDENLGLTVLAELLIHRPITGKLWIVQKTGIREYRPDEDDE